MARMVSIAGMLAAMGGPGTVAAAATAGAALEVFAKLRGGEAVKSVVMVRGERGQDQPESWEVMVPGVGEEGGVVFQVDGKRILGSRQVKGSVGGAVVDLERLGIDSDEAFRIADAEARKAEVGFDRIDYELRAMPSGNAPIWRVRLRDAAGREVAVVEINGTDGRVKEGKWNVNGGTEGRGRPRSEAGRGAAEAGEIEESAGAMRAGSEQVVASAANREGERKSTPEGHREAYGDLWERSTKGIVGAGTNARDGFKRVGTTIADVFRGRAEYRPSGKRRWSPNHGAASRGH